MKGIRILRLIVLISALVERIRIVNFFSLVFLVFRVGVGVGVGVGDTTYGCVGGTIAFKRNIAISETGFTDRLLIFLLVYSPLIFLWLDYAASFDVEIRKRILVSWSGTIIVWLSTWSARDRPSTSEDAGPKSLLVKCSWITEIGFHGRAEIRHTDAIVRRCGCIRNALKSILFGPHVEPSLAST